MIRGTLTVVVLSFWMQTAVGAEFQVGPFCDSTNADPSTCVLKLVSRWEHRDGAAFWEVGSALSSSFCQHPTIVLDRLSSDPTNLESWVDRLPEHTFRVFDHADTQFGQSATTHLRTLKKCMVRRATELLHDQSVGPAASELLTKLEQTEVTYID